MEIDRAEEKRLVLAWQAGDRSAGAQVLVMHRRLLEKWVARYRRWLIPSEDLLQTVKLGFLKGLLTWREDAGTQPAWWALNYVKTELRECVAKDGYPIAVSQIAHVENMLGLRQGLAPEPWSTRPEYLDEVLVGRRGDAGGTRRVDLLAAEEIEPRDVSLVDLTMDKLERLPPREQEVLRRHYLGGESMSTIGKSWGVSRERVRQIEARALRRLRRKLGVTL